MFAKIATDAYFNMSVSLENPSGDPAISDDATFTAWLNVTIVNPSDRRLTLHYFGYSGWIHDLEVENGSSLDRRPQDNFLPQPDGSIQLFYRSFAGAYTFPVPTEFIEPHAQRTFSFPFSLVRDLLPIRFDATRSIVRFAQAHNLTWADVDWFHHALLRVQILDVPTNYEETSIYYLHTFPIIDREAGFELPS